MAVSLTAFAKAVSLPCLEVAKCDPKARCEFDDYTLLAVAAKPRRDVTGLAISLGAGLFFGIYPAVKAVNLDPVRCLRHE